MPLVLNTVSLYSPCSQTRCTFTLSTAWARSLSDIQPRSEKNTSFTLKPASKKRKTCTTCSIVVSMTRIFEQDVVPSSTASFSASGGPNSSWRRGSTTIRSVCDVHQRIRNTVIAAQSKKQGCSTFHVLVDTSRSQSVTAMVEKNRHLPAF